MRILRNLRVGATLILTIGLCDEESSFERLPESRYFEEHSKGSTKSGFDEVSAKIRTHTGLQHPIYLAIGDYEFAVIGNSDTVSIIEYHDKNLRKGDLGGNTPIEEGTFQ